MTKPWQRINEQTSRMGLMCVYPGWYGKVRLLGGDDRMACVGWKQGGRNRPITNRSEKKTGSMKEAEEKQKKEKQKKRKRNGRNGRKMKETEEKRKKRKRNERNGRETEETEEK